MGFRVELFEKEPDEEVICPLCLGVFDDPVVDPCGHVFCKDCLMSWLDSKKKCPISSRQTLSDEIKPDIGKKSQINELRIVCVICKSNYFPLSRYPDACFACANLREVNRTDAMNSFASRQNRPAPQLPSFIKPKPSSSYFQNDLVKWAAIVGGCAAAALTVSSRMNHDQKSSKK